MGKTITAIILAGGKGERLRPLTITLPKPMVKIHDKPILEYVLTLFQKNNIKDIIISVCYLPNLITEYFGDGSKFGLNISYVYENEDNPLGTAGSIAKLEKQLNETFIVCYGDSLRDVNISSLLKEHQSTKPVATICIYKNENPDPKSNVIFDENKTIVSFVERPSNTDSSPTWSNAGFYILEPEVFNYIPQNQKSDFGKDIFPAVLADNKQIKSFIINGYFLDIGTKEKLSVAQKDIADGKLT